MEYISDFLGTHFSFFGQKNKKYLSVDNPHLIHIISALCLVCLCNRLISLTFHKLFRKRVLLFTLRVAFYFNPWLKYWSVYKSQNLSWEKCDKVDLLTKHLLVKELIGNLPSWIPVNSFYLFIIYCCLIHIITLRHILYLAYLCPCLGLCLFMSCICYLFFIFSLIFIAINHITSLKQTYLFLHIF